MRTSGLPTLAGSNRRLAVINAPFRAAAMTANVNAASIAAFERAASEAAVSLVKTC